MQYYVAIAGKQSGPYAEEAVRALLTNGAVTADSLAWYEGLPNWAPLKTVLPVLSTPPPLIPHTLHSNLSIPKSEEQKIPDRGIRLGATFIDISIGFICFFLGAIISIIFEKDAEYKFLGPEISGFFLLFVLIIQLLFLLTQQQTIGKKVLRIKIVKAKDQSKPSFIRLLLRGFLSLIVIFPFFGIPLVILDGLFIFREDRRCIHDHIAGTIVIKA